MGMHRGRKWWVTAGLTAAVAGLAAGSFAAQAAGADREDVSDLHFLALSALVLLVGMLVASRDGRMRDLEQRMDDADKAWEIHRQGRAAAKAAAPLYTADRWGA